MENVPEAVPEAKKPNWLIIGLVAALFVLTGVAAYEFGQTSKPKAAATPTPIASASLAPIGTNPASVSDKYASWTVYNSTVESGLSFKYPPAWKAVVKSNSIDKAINPTVGFTSYDTVDLTGPHGTVINYSPFLDGLGGGCDPTTPTWKYAYSQSADDTNYTVVGVTNTKGEYAFGVVAKADAKPVGTDTGSCLFYPLLKSKTSDRQMWFMTYGSVQNNADNSDVEQILKTFSYK